MDTDERKLSKLYRKIVTADRIKAIMLFERLNHDEKERIRSKFIENGSEQAISLLEKLDNVAT